MIKQEYKDFISTLQENRNIEMLDYLTNMDLMEFSIRLLRNEQRALLEKGISISDANLEYFEFSSIRIGWRSKLEIPGTILQGGFVMNGLTDALLFPSSSDFWKGAFSLAPDKAVPQELEHYNKLGWFEKRPDGMDDTKRGCFIRQEGKFPPPIAFYSTDAWYTKLDFGYEEYLSLIFENYAFVGWQFFYIDITPDIPRLDEILEEMKNAVEKLPLHFPEKDWSYHIKRYNDTIEKLK